MSVPQVLSYEERTHFVEVQFRKASRFQRIRTPEWAQKPAAKFVKGALVKTGPLEESGAWVVHAVLLPRSYAGDDQEKALDAARHIIAKIETKGRPL